MFSVLHPFLLFMPANKIYILHVPPPLSMLWSSTGTAKNMESGLNVYWRYVTAWSTWPSTPGSQLQSQMQRTLEQGMPAKGKSEGNGKGKSRGWKSYMLRPYAPRRAPRWIRLPTPPQQQCPFLQLQYQPQLRLQWQSEQGLRRGGNFPPLRRCSPSWMAL